MTENDKKILEKYINTPRAAELIEKDNYPVLFGEWEDFIEDNYDTYTLDGSPDAVLAELLVLSGVYFDNVTITSDGQNAIVRIPEKQFIDACVDALTGDYQSEDIVEGCLLGKTPFNYKFDEYNLKDWVINNKDLKDMLWDEHGKSNLSSAEMSNVIDRLSDMWNEELYDFWSERISYNMYDSMFGFRDYKADTNYNKTTQSYDIKLPIKELLRTLYNSEMVDGDTIPWFGTSFVKVLLENVEKITEPYMGWGDEVELDDDYVTEEVKDVLGWN